MSSVQPRCQAGTSVETPCSERSVEPSAWIRTISAACRRLQKRARAMLPLPSPSLIVGPVRVIATR